MLNKLLKNMRKLSVTEQTPLHNLCISSVQLLSCVRLCDPMYCSMPGFPVHHQLQEPA